MARHGVLTNGDLRVYFTRGKIDTPEKPGGHYSPLYQRHRQNRQKRANS